MSLLLFELIGYDLGCLFLFKCGLMVGIVFCDFLFKVLGKLGIFCDVIDVDKLCLVDMIVEFIFLMEFIYLLLFGIYFLNIENLIDGFLCFVIIFDFLCVFLDFELLFKFLKLFLLLEFLFIFGFGMILFLFELFVIVF